MRRGNVLTIEPGLAKVDNETIRLLTEVQRRAVRGEIQGCALVTITSDAPGRYQAVSTAWAGDGASANIHTVVGAVDHLKARMMHAAFHGIP